MVRKDVVDDERRAGHGRSLDIHEIAQRELEEMEPVDEGEIGRRGKKAFIEKRIAFLCDHRGRRR
jgi:hypothetical protein